MTYRNKKIYMHVYMKWSQQMKVLQMYPKKGTKYTFFTMMFYFVSSFGVTSNLVICPSLAYTSKR